MGLGNGGADQFGIPNVIPGCKTTSPGSLSYINTNCYTPPTAPASFASQCAPFPGAPALPLTSPVVYCANLLGNAGRNSITGPHLVNVDFSMVKNTAIKRISETFNVQFRAEIFNIFNHTNFLPPEPVNNNAGAAVLNTDGSVFTPANGGGAVDSLATQPRDVQFAIKVIW